MNPTRILPDLQCSLMCEEVRQEISGNFILLGIIAYVRVPQLPITALKLCVFNRWTAGVGQFTETVRLVAPDEPRDLRSVALGRGVLRARSVLADVNHACLSRVSIEGSVGCPRWSHL